MNDRIVEQLNLETRLRIALAEHQFILHYQPKIDLQSGEITGLEDFGTGHSSLSYLVKLPANCLKIDRSFIVDLASHTGHREVVAAVISLAHSVSMTVVAEGVETSEQAAVLRQLTCDELQGFIFSRPIPLERIDALLRKNYPRGTSVQQVIRPAAHKGSH